MHYQTSKEHFHIYFIVQNLPWPVWANPANNSNSGRLHTVLGSLKIPFQCLWLTWTFTLSRSCVHIRNIISLFFFLFFQCVSWLYYNTWVGQLHLASMLIFSVATRGVSRRKRKSTWGPKSIPMAWLVYITRVLCRAPLTGLAYTLQRFQILRYDEKSKEVFWNEHLFFVSMWTRPKSHWF